MIRPRLADDTTLLCDVAAHLLRQRVEKYPAFVSAAKMTQADADNGIRIMSAVAARWRMVPIRDLMQPRPDALDLATEQEMRDTLAAAATRTSQIATADPSPYNTEYAAIVAALLWHAERALAAEASHRTRHAQAA